MQPRSFLALAASTSLLAFPASAQNSSAEPPPLVVPPPPPTRGSETAPSPAAPPAPPAQNTPAPEPSPEPETVTERVVVAPPTSPAPSPEPMTIDPDAAYPEGFADPEDPFANDLSDSYRQSGGGFDWGLLGLLGLLGLIPLFRRNDRAIYVERGFDRDEPRRVHRPPEE